MDNSLAALCEAVKKVIWPLKPQHNPLSFLIMTGRPQVGKTAILRQSQLEEATLFGEHQAKIYYNRQGVIVELSESWLNQQNLLPKQILKQLNRCHRAIKISGVILCVDIKKLLVEEPVQLNEEIKEHTQLLQRFTSDLAYPVDCFLLFTKLDALAGFSEFYQGEHGSDLAKPLGFSIEPDQIPSRVTSLYQQQFNQFVEILGQQIIHKLHPARSSLKRTLIREFPLQLLSLRQPIQLLIQKIAASHCRLRALYFTSAEQGGTSIDRLNKKIQHEYALTVQDTFSQATNYRPYFIDGAIEKIQAQTTLIPAGERFSPKTWGLMIGSLTTVAVLILMMNYFKTFHILDETSKELLTYESLLRQNKDDANALYHLTRAKDSVAHLNTNALLFSSIHQLKSQLQKNTKEQLNVRFLPSITGELETVINDPKQTPVNRYKALKIYLMLKEPEHFSTTEVIKWFTQRWQRQSVKNIDEKIKLLQQAIRQPLQPFSVHQDIVNDARNYLNALPASYFYYSLAKEYFPSQTQSIDIKGFDLVTRQLPVYYTKSGFYQVMRELPAIRQKIQDENWVLSQQDFSELQSLLTEAYCYDYVSWWNNFLNRSRPSHFQNYREGRQLFQTLHQSSALRQLLTFVQMQTNPELNDNKPIFNQLIANQFTDLNLISLSSIQEFNQTLGEMEKFMLTLSVIKDQGKTAFHITKGRFNHVNSSDPITILYSHSQRLPEPVSNWIKQLADDSWVLLINDTRQYINQKWQDIVFKEYQTKIAHRYPFEASQNEIALSDFNHFFSTHGIFNQFINDYIKPFLNTSSAKWQPKAVNEYLLPISKDMMNEIIRANIITNMFFPNQGEESKIEFSLQKINLDPVIANLELKIGHEELTDNQDSESYMPFRWPQLDAKLSLDSIDGNHYELSEKGVWAFFRLLEKVNIIVDETNSSSLQILFEINSNSGRYLLRTSNPVNPFIPGILNGFGLQESIV
ncbi:type VI secretion protein IcmF [Legionella israelensis]|uniref:Type VI secretion protein IcmF n=1 Tax=Legionella israelensis TaxID=454 RepID=A0AAX1EDZ2_9GAMM|nr:type IVB secretion system protein IcmF [Legionella israelensis]QBR83250.1 type VI secretion protein IcmF [Legionella israelensis]